MKLQTMKTTQHSNENHQRMQYDNILFIRQWTCDSMINKHV